jgi:hypothetical protein
MLLRPNKTRAKAAMIFLVIALVTDLGFIISSYLQEDLLPLVATSPTERPIISDNDLLDA